MKTKRFVVLVLSLVCSLSLFAGDWKYTFWNLDQHPEILGGFLPTYIGMGVSYDGLHFVPERKTEIRLLAGGGYYQQKMWQDPTTGQILAYQLSPLIYDVMEFEWLLQFSQGFGASPVAGKDLWTISLAYEGFYRQTMDSMVTGKSRTNNGKTQEVPTVESWFSGLGSSSTDNKYYTDMGSMLGTNIKFGVKWDRMDDQLSTQDGIYSEIKGIYAPLLFNQALTGKADFYSITSNTVMAKTLYSLRPSEKETKKNTFSIVLVDRVNLNWTDGTKVSMRAQHPVSLGRKVRGYNSWTYNTQFTAVNNFDIRFCGPSFYFAKIVPRINLFLDAGYGGGKYFNTQVSGNDFLCSTGIQVTVSLFDFIDLGLQYAYLFTGRNYVHYNDSLVMSFTFFLDF
jgi:hypothetical protein